MSESIVVKSTSRVTADVNDIILRENTTTRLIFRPMVVDNTSNPEACVNGEFVFQRKGSSKEWEDIQDFKMTELKAEQGAKLALHSAEVLQLLTQLEAIREMYKTHGIQLGVSRFTILQGDIPDAVKQLLEHKSGDLVNALTRLQPDDLQHFSGAVSLARLKSLMKVWEENKTNADEEFWQQQLAEQNWALSQLFSQPLVFIKSKPYCGGKEVDNEGGVYSDFLLDSIQKNGAALIEIKTPTTQLLGAKYRGVDEDDANTVYALSEHASGSINQAVNQRVVLRSEMGEYKPVRRSVKSVLIIGNSDQLDTQAKRKSFNLHRYSHSEVDIITFDEFFMKVENLIKLLEGRE